MSAFLTDPDVTLYHGDCLEVLRTLDAASVDVVVTDPPYGQTSLAWDVPVRGWMPEVDRVLAPSGSVWVFGSLRSLSEFGWELRGTGWRFAQDIVWEKHNGSNFHADRFRRVHEQAAQFYRGPWEGVWRAPVMVNEATARTVRRKGRPPHTGNIGEKTYISQDGGPKLMRSVMRVRSCHGYAEHETQKPEGILRPLIEFSCPPGGTVLDPFAGSGSTLLAARQVGREGIGIEISEDYCAVAERRLSQLSLLAEAT